MKIFARKNSVNNYSILHFEDGAAVTRLPDCWPLDSNFGGGYEHAEGIRLSYMDAIRACGYSNVERINNRL